MKSSIDVRWLSEFRDRMADFSKEPAPGLLVSVKLRVDSGCFCRNCCPVAHEKIDDYRHRTLIEDRRTRLVEHESGPEILSYLQLTAAGFAFSAALINLVVAIVKARADGRKQGDRSGAPFELIIRRVNPRGEYAEEKILRIPPDHDVDTQKLCDALMKYSIPPPTRPSKFKTRASTKRSRKRTP